MTADLPLIAFQFNPRALRLARELRGKQKNELAEKLGITPSALTQFESGAAKPSALTVGKLSLALGFPASFFCAPFDKHTLSPDDCHFRSLQSCSQLERRKIVALSALLSKLIEFIDENVQLPSECVSDVQSLPTSRGRDEMEQIAQTVRSNWGLGQGPISNVVALLESKGIFVIKLLDDCKRVDAFSTFLGQRPVIFLNCEKGSASRSIFDAAHELGHLVMHHDSKPGDKKNEEEANAFAAAFLLPEESFIRECPRRLSWDHLLALKVRWRVSLAALVHRAYELGCFSEHTYRRAYVQLNQKGWRLSEPHEPSTEQPTLLTQSISLLAGIDFDIDRLADHLSVSTGDLTEWLAYSGSGLPTKPSANRNIVDIGKKGQN